MTRTAITALLAVAAIGATAATASAATSTSGDAEVTISAPFTHTAGETAPFDAPGVKAIRLGKPIPKGYVLVGRKVTIDRHTAGSTGGAFTLACPAGKTIHTLGSTGDTGPEMFRDYLGHKKAYLTAWSPPREPRSTGASYIVCR